MSWNSLAIVVLLVATGDASAQWSLESATFGVIDNSPVASVDGAVYMVRTRVPQESGQLAFGGWVDDATVTRVEYVRQIAGAGPIRAEPPMIHFSTETFQVARGFFQMNDVPRTSFVLQAQALELRPTGPILLRGSANSVGIRGEPHHGFPQIVDETNARSIPGPFLNTGMAAFEANAKGNIWLYWLNQTAILRDGSVEHQLRSEIWDEGSGGVVNRHIVWYEVGAVTTELAIRVVPEQAPNVLFAQKLNIPLAERISLASGSGDLAGMEVPADASVWLEGLLKIVASPADGDEGRSFRLDVSGQLKTFAFRGSTDVVRIAPVLAMSATLLAVVVLGAVIVTRQLLASTGFFLYTKLRKDKLLDITSRETIYRVIQQAPGIHFLELQKQVGSTADSASPIGFGALAYHLSQMERFDLIVSKREGRFRRYFDVSAKMGADAARVALLQTNPVNLVARAILDSPGLSQGDVHSRVNLQYTLTRQALSYHLRRLSSKALVVVETRGRFCHYRPTEKLERLSTFVPAGPPVSPLPPIVAAAGS